MNKIMNMIAISGLAVLLTACQSTESGGTADNKNVSTNASEQSSESLISEEEKMLLAAEDEDILEITEKIYVTYINDIYTNAESYIGKKIKLEGMFTSAYDETVGETFYFVYRTGPGCCGTDGDMCGLEFTTSDVIPQENDWIEVTGTLESYEQDGNKYLTLKDSTVTVKTERGLEVVYQ